MEVTKGKTTIVLAVVVAAVVTVVVAVVVVVEAIQVCVGREHARARAQRTQAPTVAGRGGPWAGLGRLGGHPFGRAGVP